MMRFGAFLVALGCLSAIGAAPASAEVRFRGTFTITAVQSCIARYVGETFSSTFRPAAIGGNPNVSSLTQLNQFSGDVYELTGAQFPVGNGFPVKGYGIDNLHYEFSARMYIASQAPAVIGVGTEFVQLVGSIQNMGNDPGVGGQKCQASFRGAYFRRVE